MKKKIFIVLLVLLVATSLVFASGNKGKAEEAKPTNLSVWAWDPNFNIPALTEAERIYKTSHPDFSLEVTQMVYNDIEQKLVIADQSGDYSTLPDLFLMQDNSAQKMLANYPGLFTPITKSGINFSDFAGGKLELTKYKGENYGVPFDNGAVIMAVRTDMLAKAGLTVKDFSGITWDEFFVNAKKVKEATGVEMLTTSGGSELILMIMQSAGASPYVNGKVDIKNNAVVKKAMEIYKRLIDEGLMVDYTDWDQYIASFNTGKAAGLIQGNWILSSIEAAADQSGKWAVCPLPKLSGVTGATNYSNSGGASWYVSSNCKNKDLAFDFLKTTLGSSVELYDNILLSNGVIATYIPASKSENYQVSKPYYGGQKVYSDIVEYAGKVPYCDFGSYYNDFRTALGDAINNVVQKNADIQSELNKAQDAVEFAIGG